MSYQFAHIETYSRKADKGGRSVDWVLDEADRLPSACCHVTNPRKPVVLYGRPIAELRTLHDNACAEIKYKVSGGKARSIRIDQKTLFTVIVSHELSPSEIDESPAKKAIYEAWESDTVAWLQRHYGPDLKTVIRHADEGHLHIHGYVLPADLRALEIHLGVSAKRMAKADAVVKGLDQKAANAVGDKAYKDAMRCWQDSYHDQVAQDHGLARLGPGKRRLSRAEWQAEKAQAAALKLAKEKAFKLRQEGVAYQRRVKSDTAKIMATAVAQSDLLKAKADRLNLESKRRHHAATQAERVAKSALSGAQEQAQRIIASAISRAEKFTSLGSRFRNIFDGLRISVLERKIRASYETKLRLAQDQLSEMRQEIQGAKRDLKDIKRREGDILSSLNIVGRERDILRSKLVKIEEMEDPNYHLRR